MCLWSGPGSASTQTPLGPVSALVDAGEMDCGSGLLLLITRAMRRLGEGDLLAVRSQEPSVVTDLPVWADLTGNPVAAELAVSLDGPWWFAVRKAAARDQPVSVCSQGDSTPVGHRLWAHTNFDCNLACSYCCAESSPRADARRLDPVTARAPFTELRELGGREVFLAGGEPFMHPQLGELVDAPDGPERTIHTNAMVFGRGRRRETLEALDPSVVLQVSLDSATPDLHDRQRGTGAWARALDGIALARSLGRRIRVAATMYDEDAWWHPVAVTNPNIRIADSPLPVAEVLGVVWDTMAVQGAAAASGREVFRCA